MKEHPILFSAPMVRAILAERKTVTRRVLKPQPRINSAGLLLWNVPRLSLQGDADMIAMHQKWQRGDRMWVREAWRALQKFDDLSPRHLADDRSKVTYEADPEHRNPLWAFGRLRASMHMPRWASRITLEVTSVKVERLQDIGDGDAIAEGVGPLCHPLGRTDLQWVGTPDVCKAPARAFVDLWTSINGQGSWEANPWVVAIAFKRVTP